MDRQDAKQRQGQHIAAQKNPKSPSHGVFLGANHGIFKPPPKLSTMRQAFVLALSPLSGINSGDFRCRHGGNPGRM
jgi:hypothetical protein